MLMVAVTFCAAFPCFAQVGSDTNEIWVSARTNALGSWQFWGSGTYNDPYYGDFDAIIDSQPTNTTIHLLPGVFYTKGFEFKPGDPYLKAGQRLLGAGIDTTIICKDTNFNYDDRQMQGVVWSEADGVEVANLTVDCSGNSSLSYKIVGVGLFGNNCYVRRVKVIHWCGNFSTANESPAISMGGATTSNNIVSKCVCLKDTGTYDDGIGIDGQGIVEDCRVDFPSNNGNAYLCADANNTRFSGNECSGGGTGFYTDTDPDSDLTIIGNTFSDVINGIVISKTPELGWLEKGLFIKDNIVELSTNFSSGWQYGINLWSGETNAAPWRRIMISGNTVNYIDGSSPAAGVHVLGISVQSALTNNIIGVQVLGNEINRAFVNNPSSPWHYEPVGVVWANNVDENGVPTKVNNLGASSPSTLTLNYTDGTVFVTSTTTQNVVLPPAMGFSAKEVVIVNEKTTGNISVTAPSGNSLYPSSPITIAPYGSAQFISDGSSAWTEE